MADKKTENVRLAILKKEYEKCCNEYVKLFCKKQGLQVGSWVADTVGGVIECSDYYINFDDIVWDINSNKPKGLILEWYNDCLDFQTKYINYFSYSNGLRFTDLKD